MQVEVKIPSPGESITEVVITTWFVADGAYVEKNQEIAELESDKATLTLNAGVAGKLTIIAAEGETIEVGAVACTIDDSAVAPDTKPEKPARAEAKASEAPAKEVPVEKKPEPKPIENKTPEHVKLTPLSRNMLEKQGISVDEFLSNLNRSYDHQGAEPSLSEKTRTDRHEDRKKMTPLRKKLSARLVQVKNQTAMLTTFNEVDMSAVMSLRSTYKTEFEKKFEIKLGFMSFFTKAAAIALNTHPNINAMIDGEDIVYFNYADIGIAVQTTKGLMVPVIRNADQLSLAEIEHNLASLAQKARDAKISLDELTGGTFTITNGGVFGSLLSTPILNPPQAAILGMHTIKERPVAENGQVVIRPMMYLALSYDHRLVDGKDSVGFLVQIKELIEHPERMLVQGEDPGKKLVLG